MTDCFLRGRACGGATSSSLVSRRFRTSRKRLPTKNDRVQDKKSQEPRRSRSRGIRRAPMRLRQATPPVRTSASCVDVNNNLRARAKFRTGKDRLHHPDPQQPSSAEQKSRRKIRTKGCGAPRGKREPKGPFASRFFSSAFSIRASRLFLSAFPYQRLSPLAFAYQRLSSSRLQRLASHPARA